jgi:hypothetical protein
MNWKKKKKLSQFLNFVPLTQTGDSHKKWEPPNTGK